MAEYVLYNPTRYSTTTRSYGAPIAGTVTATSACGSTSGALAGAFTLSSFSDPIYYYQSSDEIFRVPLAATAPLPTVTATVAGYTQPMAYVMNFGCTAANCADPPGVLVGAAMGLDGYVVGYATGRTYAWPDTVQCGTTTPLPLTLTKDDGTEGYVGPGVTLNYRIPGGASPTRGTLAYEGVDGGQFPTVPYTDARAGEVTYAAPACAAITQPAGVTLWVEGVISHFLTVVTPPPVGFRIVPDPDTLGAGHTAYFPVVAVSAAGTESYLDPATPVTLTVSDATLGVVSSGEGSATRTGATITVPYRTARSSALFYAFGSNNERITVDTLVAITATGGGLSGTGTVTLLAPPRLDLVANPSALPNGGASRLYATIRGTQAANIAWTAPLTFTLAEPLLGTLYRRSTGQRGTTLTGVPRLAASQGDVIFDRGCSGPPSPAGTAHITAAVDGRAGLVDDVSISVGERLEAGPPPTSPNLLQVSVLPSPLAPGDSAAVSVTGPGGDCTGGGGSLTDSTLMAVGVPSGYHGDLSYEGQRGTVFFDVPYVDLREGRVRFVADGEVPCEDDTVEVHVEGGGLTGFGSFVIEGDTTSARNGGLAMTGQCPVNWLTETRESIQQWHVDNCPGFSQPLSEIEKEAISLNYERILAEHLFGGMGWGRIEGYPRSYQDGVDGYLKWYLGNNGIMSSYVSTIFESKLKNTPPISSERDSSQVMDHINFLGDQYDAWVESPIHPANSVGTPILILASQNQWDGESGWQVGYSPALNNAVLDQANERGVAVVHVQIAEVGGYRYLMVQFMNRISILDPNNRFLQWIRRLREVDLRGRTYHLWPLPIDFECGRVAATGSNRASPPFPF